MENKVKTPINAKVRVYWDDKIENYNKESKSQIKTYFAKKYNLSRKSINVIFRPIKIDDNGNRISITGANLENVMDVNYQRQLFKEWLKREEKNVSYDDIIKIDDEVNLEVTQDMTEFRQRNYALKWIKIDNFLCFGDVKPIYIDRLKGITCVSSHPVNQGGKCIRYNSKIKIKYNLEEIVENLGFLPKEIENEIEIGKLEEIYTKYGNLGFEVETPYGYKNIEWCGITEENAEIYRLELENGL